MTNQKEKRKVPELRFPEFSGEWEEKRVEELYDFKNGLNKGKEFFGKGTPIVNFKDVFNNRELKMEDIKGKVEVTDKEKELYSVKKGDLFFTRTSEIIEEIGMPSVITENMNNTVFSGFVLRARIKENIEDLNNYFKKYVFITSSFRQEMIKKSSMTTRALTSGTAINKMIFHAPKTIEEQQKIGEFFSKLDRQIELEEKKLSLLEEQKKGYMQKIFSQELRFKDENGEEYPEWEDIQLKKIVKINTGKLDANAMIKNGEYPFFTCAKEVYSINDYIFDEEVLLISGNGANVGYIHYYNGKFNAYQRTYILRKCKEEIKYIKLYLDYFLKKRIESEKRSGNTPYITLNTLADMIIKLPNRVEQKKIYYIFEVIDKKIENQRGKLNLLRIQKKEMLNKTFI